MKCQNCQQENKDNAKVCKRCSHDLTLPPAWLPDWKWHARTLAYIYMGLTLFYFGVSFALKSLPTPYHLRKIPAELTPWLKR
ncbi:MAG: hypothetical protein WCU88_09280 [Elusimicrobiota bacterium]|jgi:hypothetical protein